MDLTFVVNTMWVIIASTLVFIMHAGFALVEIGSTQSKNAVNIIMKNIATIALGVLCYYFVGYAFMYGKDALGVIGTTGYMIKGTPDIMSGVAFNAYFLYQSIFAATCATIVSGAVAERTKFSSYITFVIVGTAFIYPLIGHWIWGGGFLNKMGFVDFAGGTAVHVVGGFCALIGAKMVGRRTGRTKGNKNVSIPGHNIPFISLGVLLLWFGWFGFNGGSTLDITSPTTSHAVLVTLLGGCASTVSSMLFGHFRYGKVDALVVLNGALAGLVGVTAGAHMITFTGGIIIGILAGIVYIFAAEFVEDVLKVDDPVGAVGLHGVCGGFGTICVGLFATEGGLFYGGGIHMFLVQVFGLVVCAATAMLLSYITFAITDKVNGLRVKREHEVLGLDFVEHKINAYADVF